MRPCVNGVAAKVGHNLRQLAKLGFKRLIARYIVFGNATKPHRAPLVMVARKPKFADIRKGLVFFNRLVVKMAMIIDYG